jgi:pimeloyl-ACP methyl ester carboxylesterase
MIKHNNYPEETHEVRTDDGYILTIHRIPHRTADPERSKPVVLLLHGLLCSSADWVIAGAQKGLGNPRKKVKPLKLPTAFVFRRKVGFSYAIWTMTKS